MKRPDRFTSVLVLFLALSQCGSFLGREVKTRTVWESGEGYIRLFHEVGGGNRYDHPFSFHQGDMTRLLESVYYSKHRFFTWSPSTRVFEQDQAEALAPHFQRAFLEAGPQDQVEFYLPLEKAKLLGVSGQTLLTRGRAFIRGHELHLHFDNVNQKVRSYASHAEDQEPLPPSGWKLIPQKGQALGTRKPSGAAGPENDHWLTVDLAYRPAPEQAAPPPAPPPASLPPAAGPARAPAGEPAGTNSPAREKLRELRDMQEEGLISPEDYERKKQEILEGF